MMKKNQIPVTKQRKPGQICDKIVAKTADFYWKRVIRWKQSGSVKGT